MLNSPPPVSDNFLNEAHYVLIDFSYSFSPVNTPKVLLLHSALPAPHSAPPVSLLFPLRLSPPPPAQLPARRHCTCAIYPSIRSFLFFFFFFLSARSLSSGKTAEHLRELNGFQLAKQIPPLTLTLSHSTSESLGGHYRQLEFNKPNMLTVLMEREEGRARREGERCALIIHPTSLPLPRLLYFSYCSKSPP